MTDALANAQQIAAKHQARVDSLRAEIARRKAEGRGPRALERAEAALPGAERLAADAAERVAALTRKAAAAKARADRAAVFSASMIRRLDKAAPQASAVMDQWKKDRAEEPKRLGKRKRQIVRAVTADLQGGGAKNLRRAPTGELRPDTKRRRDHATPPVEAVTFPSGPIIPYVPPKLEIPARDGLLAGDFRLIDRSPDDFDAFRLPKQWTADYVAKRLADAHAVLRRLPMTTRPKEFGAIWPEYVHAAGELAYQAGAGTLHMGKGRAIRGTSADDVARMNEALAWPMTYLKGSPPHAAAVNDWAYWSGLDGDPLDNFARQGLEFIAASLNRGRVKVT